MTDIESDDFGPGDGAGVPEWRERMEQQNEEAQARKVENTLWGAVGVLWMGRKLIMTITVVAAIGAIVLALVLPVYYAASARVLLPDSGGGGGIGALLGQLSPAAAGLLGGGGDYTRYLAILTSRSIAESAVSEFDLSDVYEMGDEPDPIEAAVEEFADNVDFTVDLEYDFLGVTVLDQDPERAAALANFLVEELNRRNASLAMQNARLFRSYVERRYNEALAALDSARADLQGFQERYGVIELPSMATAFLESMAEQQGQLTQAEVQYQALLQQYGPDNPQVRQAREIVRAARRAQQSVLEGQGSLMPISMDDLPELANQYAEIYQELLTQQAILEAAQPLYEQARFDEERDRIAVQVVDPAVPPLRKAKPHRSVLVIVITISAFVLSLIYVFLHYWLSRNWAHLENRLREVTS